MVFVYEAINLVPEHKHWAIGGLLFIALLLIDPAIWRIGTEHFRKLFGGMPTKYSDRTARVARHLRPNFEANTWIENAARYSLALVFVILWWVEEVLLEASGQDRRSAWTRGDGGNESDRNKESSNATHG
jgi:hypothetical protein